MYYKILTWRLSHSLDFTLLGPIIWCNNFRKKITDEFLELFNFSRADKYSSQENAHLAQKIKKVLFM